MTWTRTPPSTTGTYLVWSRRTCNAARWWAGVLVVRDRDLPVRTPPHTERLYQVPGLSHVDALAEADRPRA